MSGQKKSSVMYFCIFILSNCSLYENMSCVYVCRHVGGLLEFSDSQCYVIEDSDMAVSGYAVTCPDAGQYYKWFDETWLPSIKDKCPKMSASDSDSQVCLEKLGVVYC